MKISLIHPSRGRPEQAYQTFLKWMNASSIDHEIEHILALDNDDHTALVYRDYAHFGTQHLRLCNSKIISGNNDCVVRATNHACQFATGDILIYLSDDFDCPERWDALIVDEVNKFGGATQWLLKVDDCLQKFHADVLTIPIMSMALYKRLGYFWHEEYKSMWVDVDLYHTTLNIGALRFAQHLKFPHNHYSNGKAKKDATYIRSDGWWHQGKAIHDRRKLAGWPENPKP